MARYFGSNRELARRNIGVVGRFEMTGIIPVKISGKNMLPEWPRAARSSQWQTRPGAAAHLCDDRRCADDPAHAPGLRVHAAVCRGGGALLRRGVPEPGETVRASPDGSSSPTILRSSNSCSAGPRAWTSSGIIRLQRLDGMDTKRVLDSGPSGSLLSLHRASSPAASRPGRRRARSAPRSRSAAPRPC